MKGKKIYDFKIGETVVYPKHGVGEITKIENMEISNIKTSFYVVKMEQSKLIIRVPLDKKDEVGLRKISSKKIIDNVYNTLKLKPKICSLENRAAFFLYCNKNRIIVRIYYSKKIKTQFMTEFKGARTQI